jgi:hypothetical protein
MRTSSSLPANHSDQMPLPPSRSAPVLAVREPVRGAVATWFPLTNSRSVVAS